MNNFSLLLKIPFLLKTKEEYGIATNIFKKRIIFNSIVFFPRIFLKEKLKVHSKVFMACNPIF